MNEFSDVCQETYFSELDNVISLNEVINSVNKAVRLHNGSSEMLKNGFPIGARTTDHIFVLRTLAEKYLMHSNPEKLYACFVDFHKAYDSVWRQSLLYKLLRSKFYKIVENIMSYVLLCVKIGQYHRSDFNIINGFKQGDVMSPCYLIFVNDLSNMLGNDLNTTTTEITR